MSELNNPEYVQSGFFSQTESRGYVLLKLSFRGAGRLKKFFEGQGNKAFEQSENHLLVEVHLDTVIGFHDFDNEAAIHTDFVKIYCPEGTTLKTSSYTQWYHSKEDGIPVTVIKHHYINTIEGEI